MNTRTALSISLLSAVFFTWLFHKTPPGLNLFIFEAVILAWMVYSGQFSFSGRNRLTAGIGLVLTAIFTVATHSVFSYIMNYLMLFVFVGIVIYPEARSVVNTIGLSFYNSIASQIVFVTRTGKFRILNHRVGAYTWKSRIFIIPLAIVAVFVLLYRFSNPVFDGILVRAENQIQTLLTDLFRNFDFLIAVTFLSGLIISNFIFLRERNEQIVNSDMASRDRMERIKTRTYRKFGFLALMNEYRAAIFLLLTLNAVLLIVNIIDIRWVWFSFEWQGQYLKQFVHEGTYLLILSILISTALVLYFFRGNLNFYAANTFLKYLSYLWLLQNGILAVSVGLRNYWYIHYFSLAYKRIGVIIFLILTLYGLYTVLVKVLKKKSTGFLFRTNAYATLFVLTISSAVNWDSLIARYNFSHANNSFLHLNYLSTLSDKALPYLDKPMDELNSLEQIRKKNFPFEEEYMAAVDYHHIIWKRKAAFKKKWEAKGLLSWNLPEYLAYRQLFAHPVR